MQKRGDLKYEGGKFMRFDGRKWRKCSRPNAPPWMIDLIETIETISKNWGR